MRGAADLERARELVLRYGWNSTAYQILNPGIRLWFNGVGDAVVGHVERNGVRVVAGAPVCDSARLARVVADFEADAADAGCAVCYFAAGDRLETLLAGSPEHTSLLIGAQPAWPPSAWPEMLASHASLRQQINRARNKGIEIVEWREPDAERSPALRACLSDWLDSRGLPPLHFLVEPQILSRLGDRLMFVARREGGVVAFLIASPVPLRRGWLIEQIVRCADAPNGTSELLIDAAVSAMAARGDEHVTLGLAPLSRRAGIPAGTGPVWLRALLAWIRAHVHRFYNFQGLESFKAKFRPSVWEPIYLIVNAPRITPKPLRAVAAAFSDGSVASTMARAIASAIRDEARWLTRGD